VHINQSTCFGTFLVVDFDWKNPYFPRRVGKLRIVSFWWYLSASDTRPILG
jgi:uncharacterized secreted protein with C-terminal beta-propeller domain